MTAGHATLLICQRVNIVCVWNSRYVLSERRLTVLLCVGAGPDDDASGFQLNSIDYAGAYKLRTMHPPSSLSHCWRLNQYGNKYSNVTGGRRAQSIIHNY